MDQGDREMMRRLAIEKARKSMRGVELAEVTAKRNGKKWSVKIKTRADECFYISGHGSGLDVYLTETNAGYLVSVTNYNRCGHLPGNCNPNDVQEYLDIDNEIDATTLAFAINFIIDSGLVRVHPEIQYGKRKNPST